MDEPHVELLVEAWRTFAVRTTRAPVPAVAVEAAWGACGEAVIRVGLGRVLLLELRIAAVTPASTSSAARSPI